MEKQSYKLELLKSRDMMFFTYHCWSKIPSKKSGCTKAINAIYKNTINIKIIGFYTVLVNSNEAREKTSNLIIKSY